MPSLTTPFTNESVVNKPAVNYSFPYELDDSISEALRYNRSRPFMRFGTVKSNVNIYLPIPEGLSFSDGAEYSTIDLGFIGKTVSDLATNALDEGLTQTLKDAFQGEFTPKSSKVAQIAVSGFASQTELGRSALFSTKRIANPNTNTTFTGVTLRNFSFTFKLVGRSPEDSKRIRDIHETFRYYTYPESDDSDDNIVLNYPDIWTIKFFDTFSEAERGIMENQFIPKIYECYLTGMTTNLNSSSSMFRRDGAPVEIDFTLNFQETRTLIRQDFERGDSRRGSLRLNPSANFLNKIARSP